MSKYLVALAILVSVVGCKEKSEEAPKQKDGLVPKLEEFADMACACKDHECTKTASNGMAALARTVKPAEIPADDIPKLQAAQARLEKCSAALHPKVVEYAALTEEVCACKDKKCAAAVADKFKAWADDLRATKEALPGGLDAISGNGLKAGGCLKKHGLDIPQ